MSKHTPAPWVISEDGWHIVSKTHYNTSTDSHLSVPKNGSICVVPDTVISDEAEANAKLIAAAPELLEALERALHDFRKMTWTDETYNIIEATIKKATL